MKIPQFVYLVILCFLRHDIAHDFLLETQAMFIIIKNVKIIVT